MAKFIRSGNLEIRPRLVQGLVQGDRKKFLEDCHDVYLWAKGNPERLQGARNAAKRFLTPAEKLEDRRNVIKGQLGLAHGAKHAIDDGALESLELMVKSQGWWDLGLVGIRAAEVKWVGTIRYTGFGRQIGNHIARDPNLGEATSVAELITKGVRKPEFWYVSDTPISRRAQCNVIAGVASGIMRKRDDFLPVDVMAWVTNNIVFRRIPPPPYSIP